MKKIIVCSVMVLLVVETGSIAGSTVFANATEVENTYEETEEDLFFLVDNEEELESQMEEENRYQCILTSAEETSERTLGNQIFSWDTYYDNESGTWGEIYVTENEETSLLLAEKNLSPTIVTNGIDIFYSALDYELAEAAVYRRSIKDGTGEELFSVQGVDSYFSLAGYDNSVIYYIRGLDPGVFCGYEITAEETTVFAENVTNAQQNNQFFYLEAYGGDAGNASEWRVFNASNGTVNLITEHRCRLGRDTQEITENAVYYLEYMDEEIYHQTPVQVSLMRCAADGSNPEILINNLEITEVIFLSENEIDFKDASGTMAAMVY